MIRNYLKIAIRNLSKHKTYSFINIFGLAVGLACCILIFLSVRYELSFDTYHPHADRIYRVVGESINPYETFHRAFTPNPLAPELERSFPEIEETARLAKISNALLEADGKRFSENRFFLADGAVFDIFAFKFLAGEPNSALQRPQSLVLTEASARKYFGEADPLGKIVRYDTRVDFVVTGVIRNSPPNSHFTVDFIASIESADEVWQRQNWLERWQTSGFCTYLRLDENTAPETLEGKFPGFINQHIKHALDDDETYKLHLQPLTDIHLHSHLSGELEANGNIQYIYIFSVVAIIILLIACSNYINLATARSEKRAREVGLRKAIGAVRGQVVRQFLSEAVLQCLAAMVFALLLVELALPWFNKLSNQHLQLQFFDEPVLATGLFIAAILLGLLSGSYPAFFLSAFTPIKTLKSAPGFAVRSGSNMRNLLVIFQFTASVALVIAFAIVQNQLHFMKNKELGYSKEQIVVLPLADSNMRNSTEALKAELMQHANVAGVSVSSGLPNRVGWHSTARYQDSQERQLEVYHLMVDTDFLDLYEIELVEGRAFAANSSDRYGAYILNEAAMRAIGWQSMTGKKFTIWDREAEVIGVVKDFHFKSLHEKIEPLALHIRPEQYRFASVKISTDDIAATLAFLEDNWHKFAPGRPFEYRFLNESFDELYRAEERLGIILRYFAILAILIACLGIYGLTAFTIEQRTREIGIRKVLGASATAIVNLLSKEFFRLVLAANLIAWPLAYLIMNKWLEDFGYRIAIGWWIFVLAGGLALAIALVTVSMQAIRAALANPVETLRYE